MERRLPGSKESGLQILDGAHLTEDALELYSLNRIQSEEDLEVVEEHLLICGYCQNRQEKMDEFTKAAIAGAKAVAAREQNKKPSNLTIISIAAGLAAVLLIPAALRQNRPAADIDLMAVRQTQSATAPLGSRLNLKPDRSGLPAEPLHWEIASTTGTVVQSGTLPAGADRIAVAALEAGQYWVRLKSPGGEPLREFSLSVR